MVTYYRLVQIYHRRIARTTVRGLLDRDCRDEIGSHAGSFGGHVAIYRVECTPPQNSRGRGSGPPSNSGTGTLSATGRIGSEVKSARVGYNPQWTTRTAVSHTRVLDIGLMVLATHVQGYQAVIADKLAGLSGLALAELGELGELAGHAELSELEARAGHEVCQEVKNIVDVQ